MLHHVSLDRLAPAELAAVGLTSDELDAVTLLAAPRPLCDTAALDRAEAIVIEPGWAGDVARAVACAALTDRLHTRSRA